MANRIAINRFTDVDEEPTETSLPTIGYEKQKVVSLREAVAQIEPPIDNLEIMVLATERFSKDPSDGLTFDESASIRLYTMDASIGHGGFYTLMNQKLRSKQRSELKSWYPYLKLFLTALYKLPSLKMIIWRGIHGDISDLYEKDYIWWGVSSCTKTMEVIEKVIGRSGSRTLFMIECLHGKSIQSHSFYPDEQEIILMPGTYLRVIDKWCPAEGVHIVRLREESPPYQLVPSPFNLSKTLSPVNAGLLKKPKIFKKNQTASIESYESAATHLSPPPSNYRNRQLEQYIKNNKNNSYLDLKEFSLTDNDMKIVSYYLFQNDEILTSLDLCSNQIEAEGIQYLSEALQANTKLTQLYLLNNDIGDKGARYLSEGLQTNTTLRELYLGNNQIGDKGAQYFGEGLQRAIKLTVLCLYSNQIGNKGAKYLGEGLKTNTTLTKLSLHQNHIEDKGVQYIGDGLQTNTTLTELSLDHNQIGDEGAQRLGEVLQTNKTLTQLTLHNNQIGFKGAKYLAEVLRKNRTLAELHLYNNLIDDRQALYIRQLLIQNTTLRLYLYDNKMGSQSCTIF